MSASGEMGFMDHIEELRSRLLKIVLGMAIPVMVSMFYYEDLFVFMMFPIEDMGYLNELSALIGIEMIVDASKTPAMLQAIKPADTFLSAIKLSVTVGIFTSFPIIVYQIWAFVAPALTNREKYHTVPVVFFATLFFLIGGSFAYFIVLPFALNFLANFGGELVKNQWAINEYFDLVVKFVLSFGLVFEMPLIAFVLAKIGILTPKFLRDYRRYAIVIIVVLAAVLTPPDLISQIMMAIPLLFLYEISIWITAIFRKKSPFDEE